MNINRNNYEEFFLLYADNELSAAEKAAVDAFVEQHPDLKRELQMLQQTILPHAEETIFPDKELLFRTTDLDSLVNITNYESFFVRYTDDELNNEEKAATELFVYKHPECQADFELVQQTKFQPERGIVFPNKAALYRKEEKTERPVIALWMRFAVAAILLLIAGLIWLRPGSVSKQPNAPIAVAEEKKTPETVVPAPVEKTLQDASLSEAQLASAAREEKSLTVPQIETPQKNSPSKSAAPVPAEKPQLAIADPSSSVNKKDELVASNDNIKPATQTASLSNNDITEKPVVSLASNLKPDQAITPAIEVISDKPSPDEYIYVSGTDSPKKTPLRGLLRRAGRVLEQNNPIGAEKKRGGVFTASVEQ